MLKLMPSMLGPRMLRIVWSHNRPLAVSADERTGRHGREANVWIDRAHRVDEGQHVVRVSHSPVVGRARRAKVVLRVRPRLVAEVEEANIVRLGMIGIVGGANVRPREALAGGLVEILD